MNHLLAFEIDNYQFGVHVPLIERVIPACEITPIPDAPPAVMGLINIQGTVTPVLNTRRKLGLPERGITVTDYFVIATHNNSQLALPVDAIRGLVEYGEDQLMQIEDFLAQTTAVSVVRIVDGLVMVYDPNKSLSETEKTHLAVALERAQRPNEQGNR